MDTRRYTRSYTPGRLLTAAALVMLFSTVWIGCSAHSSHMRLSYAVEDHFERSRLYPGLQYYTSGTMDEPLALVALEPDVILDSDIWKPIEMTSKQLDLWLQAFKLQPWIEYNQIPDAALIANPDGKRVWYYYSVWKYPEVRFPAANRIEIDKPVAELRVTNRVTTDDSFGLGFD